IPSGRLEILGSFTTLCLRAWQFVNGTRAGAQSKCPLQLDPQRVVVRYGGSVAVNCNTSVLHKGMGWEASEGVVPVTKDQNLITWRVPELREWDIKPVCYINLIHSAQCKVDLPVTVYKTPDSVFISTVNHRGPMMEGQQYELQCDVHNVAPVQYLTVKWYKGQTLLHQTNFTDTIETPENKTVTLLIRPDRADDGAQYWCEAELDLGAEGPQPHPTNSSKPLSIAVYCTRLLVVVAVTQCVKLCGVQMQKLVTCVFWLLPIDKPKINETKLPSVVRVLRGYPEVLVCEAEGNPKPTISWSISSNDNKNSETLTITESTPENVSCTANNTVGSTTRHVKVSIQENYIPIILVIVAVVVVIFVIFIFLYLTYYKKNRIGH
uniref:Ig-like domain-containing protein n=1 Tax=Cyprinus carpio TaxID=7962 RepID=A0A8C2HLZ4_CYPCA